jgi:riboflavin synthase
VFTGLVQAMGALKARERRGPGYRLVIGADLGPFAVGESIAVSGACLTVVAASEGGFSADVSLETADKTTLGRLPLGASLNLERSLSAGDALGGHLVSGHVDGVARIVSVEPVGEAWSVRIAPPPELLRFVAPKGSVALDGVSLTVNGVFDDAFDVMLIPHTRAVTNFSSLAPGGELNMEVDLLARYVARQLEVALGSSREASLAELLSRAGFVKDRENAQ